MKQLIPDDLKARLAAFLDLSRFPLRAPRVSIPLGRLGTYDVVPVISSPAEIRHGLIGAPSSGDLITRRQQLDIGVYDVWWDFAIYSVEATQISIHLENEALTVIRLTTGFNLMGTGAVQNQGHLAILTMEQNDQITFRIDATITGVIGFNSVIIQRLP